MRILANEYARVDGTIAHYIEYNYEPGEEHLPLQCLCRLQVLHIFIEKETADAR